jgi:hypothetical protein
MVGHFLSSGRPTIGYNVLKIGEVSDFETLNFNLELNFF